MEKQETDNMIQSQLMPLSAMVPNKGQIPGVPKNPRAISKKKLELLKRSIEDDPEMLGLREILLYPFGGKYVIIGGNMRYRALKELGHKEAIVKVLPETLTPEKLRAIAIKDNSGFGEWDWDMLANEWDEIDLGNWGIDIPGFDITPTGKQETEEEKDTEEDEKTDFLASMLGDRLYDSDNEYDIPTLRTDRQPVSGLLLPFAGWGADTRAKKGISTYHFYVEDYRFTAIWNNPLQVLESGCTELVEPNLSLFDTTPVAYGLQLIYMKRWIARLWQECGARIYADLNVAQKFYKYNRLGIPDGYNAFATRGYADRQEYLKMEIQTARDISGLDKPNMIVYGGGEKIREICLQNNVLYVEQFMANRAKLIKKGGKQNG